MLYWKLHREKLTKNQWKTNEKLIFAIRLQQLSNSSEKCDDGPTRSKRAVLCSDGTLEYSGTLRIWEWRRTITMVNNALRCSEQASLQTRKMEWTPVTSRHTTKPNIPDVRHVHNRRRENPKPHIILHVRAFATWYSILQCTLNSCIEFLSRIVIPEHHHQLPYVQVNGSQFTSQHFVHVPSCFHFKQNKQRLVNLKRQASKESIPVSVRSKA